MGPNNSYVGLATINQKFFNFTGHRELFSRISDVTLVLLILSVGYYAFIGIKQLIQKKSLVKVDKRLIYLCIFYICMAIVYIFFEKIGINNRPILENGKEEVSYPSTHTLLSMCIGFSSIMFSKYYIKKNLYKKINILFLFLVVATVLCRLLSGMHWLTDIVGGILISCSLVMILYTVTPRIGNYK